MNKNSALYSKGKGKGKGQAYPTTGHEGAEEGESIILLYL